MRALCWLNPVSLISGTSHKILLRKSPLHIRTTQGSNVPQINSRPTFCFHATAQKGTTRQIWLGNEKHTWELGRLLAFDSRPSDVLLLHGDLGAGKTALARGYIQTARRNELVEVTSPTYLLTNTYPPEKSEGPNHAPEIYHMDLWRLDDASSRPIVDFETVFSQAVSLIEWPDRLKGLLPAKRLDIFLEYPPTQIRTSESATDPWGFGTGEQDDIGSSRSGRLVSFVAHGTCWKNRIDSLFNTYALTNGEGRTIISDD